MFGIKKPSSFKAKKTHMGIYFSEGHNRKGHVDGLGNIYSATGLHLGRVIKDINGHKQVLDNIGRKVGSFRMGTMHSVFKKNGKID